MNSTAPKIEEINELKSTLFVVNGIVTELSKERDIITTSACQIAACTRQFQGYVQDIQGLSLQAADEIKSTISKAAPLMAKEAANEAIRLILEKTSGQINDEIRKLQSQSLDVSQQLKKSFDKISFFSRRVVLNVVLSTFVGGVLGGAAVYYVAYIAKPLPKAQLEAGTILLNVWSKLEKKERDKIMSLYSAKSESARN